MTDASPRRNLTLSGLLGVRDRNVVWGRLLTFVAASIAANLVYLIIEAIRPGGLPKEFRLYFLLTNLLAPFFRGAAAFVGFRFIKKDALSAAVAGLVYLPLIFPLRFLLAPSFTLDHRIIYSWMWVFLELAFLAAAVRLFRSLWLGLAVGTVASSLIAGWIQTGVESLARSGGRFTFGGSLESAGIDLAGGLVFATVFWFGLRLPWCRPERIGLEGPVPSPEAAGAAPGTEDAGLLRVLDFRALAKHLRSAGVGSLIFGVLAIGLGAGTRGASSINSVLILLGIVLIAEGIWVLAAPTPAGLIVDGIVLILLGLWNIMITGINSSRGTGGAGSFGLIGILQIGWGIQSITQYRRYARLTGPKPAAEEMKAAEARLQSLAQGAAPGAPDVIGFRPVGTAKAAAWTARLLPGALLLIFANKAVGYSPKASTVLTPDASAAADGTRKAKLRLSDRTLKIRIGEDTIARFNAWKAGA